MYRMGGEAKKTMTPVAHWMGNACVKTKKTTTKAT